VMAGKIKIQINSPSGPIVGYVDEGATDEQIRAEGMRLLQQQKQPVEEEPSDAGYRYEPNVVSETLLRSGIPQLESAGVVAGLPFKEITKEIGPAPWEMAGAIGGSVPGMLTANPLAMAGGAVLGAGGMRAAYDIVAGDVGDPITSLGDPDAWIKAWKAPAKAMHDEALWGGGFMSIAPAWRVARSYVPRMLGVGDDVALSVAAKAEIAQIPLGISAVTKRTGIARMWSSGFARVPGLGKPFQKAQIAQHQAGDRALNRLLDDVTPSTTTADLLGIDLSKAAISTTRRLKRHYAHLYTSADEFATPFGNIAPSSKLKEAADVIDSKVGLPALESGEKFSAGVAGEMQGFFDQVRQLPDFINVKELRALQKTLNDIKSRASSVNDAKELWKAEETLRSVDQTFASLDVTGLPKGVGDQIVARYQFANRFFIGTQQLADARGTQVFKRVPEYKQALEGGFPESALLNADELANVALNSGSPEAVRALRDLIRAPEQLLGSLKLARTGSQAVSQASRRGDLAFKRLVRKHLDEAFAGAMGEVKGGFLRPEGMSLNIKKLRTNLGLTGTRNSEAALAEMLEGTGTSVNHIKALVDSLGALDEIVIPSQFIARRAMMGGPSGALKGLTGLSAVRRIGSTAGKAGAAGGALATGPIGIGTLAAAMLALWGFQKIGRLLTAPKTLRTVLQMGSDIEKEWMQVSSRYPHLAEGTWGRPGVTVAAREAFLPIEAKLRNLGSFIENASQEGEVSEVRAAAARGELGKATNAAKSYLNNLGDIGEAQLEEIAPKLNDAGQVLNNFFSWVSTDADGATLREVKKDHERTVDSRIDRAFVEGDRLGIEAVQDVGPVFRRYVSGVKKNPERFSSLLMQADPESQLNAVLALSRATDKATTASILKNMRKAYSTNVYGSVNQMNLQSSEEWKGLRQAYFSRLFGAIKESPDDMNKQRVASLVFGSGQPIIKSLFKESEAAMILKYVRGELRSGLRGTIGQRTLPKTKKRLLGQISAFLGMTVSSMGKESMNGGAESFVSYAKPDSESAGEMSAMDANLLQQPLERPTL